jgi:hypothetical protein
MIIFPTSGAERKSRPKARICLKMRIPAFSLAKYAEGGKANVMSEDVSHNKVK